MIGNKEALPAKEYGTGWDMVVDRLLAQLDALPGEIQVTQRKEKFGGLRVYVTSADRETTLSADVLIRRAEALCSVVCENCGQPGETRNTRGWIRTLCSYCDTTTAEDRMRGPLDDIVPGLTDAVRDWAVAEIARLESWQARYGVDAREALLLDQQLRLSCVREIACKYSGAATEIDRKTD